MTSHLTGAVANVKQILLNSSFARRIFGKMEDADLQ
jgi:hypothetical protein